MIGVDPSLSCTGWAVIRCNGEDDTELLDFGNIRQKSSIPEVERGAVIARVVADKADYHKATVGGVENQHAKIGRGNSAIKVAAVRGAVTAALVHRGLRIVLVQPATAKKTMTGNGRASHSEMQEAVAKLFGVDVPQDVAYGIAMALVAIDDEIKRRSRNVSGQGF